MVVASPVTLARRAPWAPSWLPLIGIVALLVGVASIPAMIVYQTWADMRALHQAWTIAGPPCPQISRQLLSSVVGRRSPQAITFGGARFMRWSGAVNCQGMREGRETYAVCQFNAPGAVQVTAAGRTSLFAIGAGRKATVSVRGGLARCVLAGWWNPYAGD